MAELDQLLWDGNANHLSPPSHLHKLANSSVTRKEQHFILEEQGGQDRDLLQIKLMTHQPACRDPGHCWLFLFGEQQDLHHQLNRFPYNITRSVGNTRATGLDRVLQNPKGKKKEYKFTQSPAVICTDCPSSHYRQ